MAKLSLWGLLSFAVMTLASSIAISGPQGGVNVFTGERPVRQEFSVFKDSGPAFDLFIQSFNLFVRQNQSSLLSYYRVSGNLLNSLPNCSNMLTCPQVSTDTHTGHGTGLMEAISEAIARTLLSYSLHGTDHTSLFSRYTGAHVPSNGRMLKVIANHMEKRSTYC